MNRLQVSFSYNGLNGSDYLIVTVYPDRVYYIPISVEDDVLSRLIASICAFSSALCYTNSTVEIDSNYSVPKSFNDIIRIFNTIQKNLKIEFNSISTNYDRVSLKSARKIVHLFSGGKDSTYRLLELMRQTNKKNISCLYVAGTTINAEFPLEMKAAKLICGKLGIPLKILFVHHADYVNKGLEFRKRAIWRDMLLICVARTISNQISTGVNYDHIFYGTEDYFLQHPSHVSLFSETNLVFSKLRKILKARITGTIEELEVYKKLYLRDSIIKLTHSCFNPLGYCVPNKDWQFSCVKCRNNHIYKKIIEGKPLRSYEEEYVLSDFWIGDRRLVSILK